MRFFESKHFKVAFIATCVWSFLSFAGFAMLLTLPWFGYYGWWLDVMTSIAFIYVWPVVIMQSFIREIGMMQSFLALLVFLWVYMATPLMWTMLIASMLRLFSKK